MLKQVEQCYGVHKIAGSNRIAAITLLPAIIKQNKIAASNVKAEQCCGITPGSPVQANRSLKCEGSADRMKENGVWFSTNTKIVFNIKTTYRYIY